MFDNLETGDVESVESTSSSEQVSSSPAPSEAQSQDAATSAEKPAPFHEHPRFKELIDSNREYKSQLEELRTQLTKQMESQKAAQVAQNQPKQPSYEQIVKRLQTIDPEFGEFQAAIAKEMAAVPELKQQLQQFQEWKQQQEQQATRMAAESKLTSLYEQYKVPADRRGFYKAQIENAAYNNPNMQLKDLDNVFKSTHENLNKFFGEFERTLKSSYVSGKQKDSTPATQSGGQPAGIPGPENTPEYRIKAITDALRSGKQKA